ncbi:TPA: helix-turn-helix transcriptional regulator [Escherichia coli]|nr:helix-turn-helix transcriptional regulator [Escherichia coli]
MTEVFLSKGEQIKSSFVSLKSYRIYKPAIIYTGSHQIRVLCKDSGILSYAEPDSLILLTKTRYCYDITITSISNKSNMMIQYIDDDFVRFISSIKRSTCTQIKKIFTVKLDESSVNAVLCVLTQKKMSHFQCSHVLSFFRDDDGIMNSLASSSLNTLTDKIISIIEKDISTNLLVEDVSKMLYISTSCLRKKLQKDNLTFKKLCLDVKMKHASIQLRTTNKNVYTIAYYLGFRSVSYFIKTFKDYYGVTPKKYVQHFSRV